MAVRIKFGRETWTETRWSWKPKRECGFDKYLVFDHPRINEIEGAVHDCIKAGNIGTIGMGILKGLTGVPVLTPEMDFINTFYVCMEAKGISWAREITIRQEQGETSCSSWGLF
jgi:hypothetical protein